MDTNHLTTQMIGGGGAARKVAMGLAATELDYTTFAVALEFDEIPTLPARLAAIGAEELRAKREVLRAIHRDDFCGTTATAARTRGRPGRRTNRGS